MDTAWLINALQDVLEGDGQYNEKFMFHAEKKKDKYQLAEPSFKARLLLELYDSKLETWKKKYEEEQQRASKMQSSLQKEKDLREKEKKKAGGKNKSLEAEIRKLKKVLCAESRTAPDGLVIRAGA